MPQIRGGLAFPDKARFSSYVTIAGGPSIVKEPASERIDPRTSTSVAACSCRQQDHKRQRPLLTSRQDPKAPLSHA